MPNELTEIERRLWHRIIRRGSLILAVKSMLAVILSYFGGFYFSKLFHFPLPQIAGLWSTISASIVIGVYPKEVLTNGINRMHGTFWGAFLSAICAIIMGYNLYALALAIFLTVVFTSSFHAKPMFRLAELTASIIIIVGMTNPDIPPALNALSRFTESLIGAVVALAMAALFFPLRKKLQLMNR